MKLYRYRYESKAFFSKPVTNHSFLLRPVPLDDSSQQLIENSLVIDPVPDSVTVGKDHSGAEIAYGIVSGSHAEFGYCSQGKVRVSGMPRPDAHPSAVYLQHTGLADMCPEMRRLLAYCDNLAAASAMAANVRSSMAYVTGSTGIDTVGSEAFLQKKGVCQDFSHILIALCREAGIPARYACGFVIGEGETHAWTEIWHEGAWYGVDATSGLPCDERYVLVAFGRDASDCSVNRGVFTGLASQHTETKVVVEEIEEI